MHRYWEIDTLRGIAIVCMIVYHTTYILVFGGLVSIDIYSGFWWLFPRAIAATFLFLVGLSLHISYTRAKAKSEGRNLFPKFLARGLGILGFAMCITLVTVLAALFVPGMEGRFVLFGILHIIGVSVILGSLLAIRGIASLILGIVAIVAGIILGNYRFPFFWLMWLGLRPENYYPIDYLPLLPWGGYVLIGIFFGSVLYKNGQRRFPLPDAGNIPITRFAAFIGRHSLLIYLVHIPVIFAIVTAVNYIIG